MCDRLLLLLSLFLFGCPSSNPAVVDEGVPPRAAPAAGTLAMPVSGASRGSQAGSGATIPVALTPLGGAGVAAAGASVAGRSGSVSMPPSAAGSAGLAGAPTQDWLAGDYPAELWGDAYLELKGVQGQQDLVRQYKVHVPPSYKPEQPMPLVFCIHGLYQDPVMFCLQGAGFDKLSDAEGFILVLPMGYSNSWNAGTCCGDARDMKLDDVALFRAILGEVSKHLNVDDKRVYSTGLSNGGYMSYRLACDASDLFAGIVSGAGAIGINMFMDKTDANPDLLSWSSDFTACKLSRPLSILHIHGTADELIPFSLQAQSLALAASRMGCGDKTRPADTLPSAGDTTCVTYDGCPAGIEVTGCAVKGGGHCWFGSPDCGTGAGDLGTIFVGNNSDTMQNNQAVVGFLRAHRR